MEQFELDTPVDARAELEAFLMRNQIPFTQQQDLYSFTLAEQDCRWRTCCRPGEQAVVVYGIYPFPVREAASALRACSEINSRVLYGSLFLQEDRLVFRTCADLFDAYTAAEALTKAVEYNASVIVEFWKELYLSSR